jgi:hypothetical protein
MIGYGIWDQTNLISNRVLRRYIRDTFIEILMDFGEVHIDHDLERLIESQNDKVTHLVVFFSGHTIRSHKHFKKAVARLCDEDFLVAGHIIHHVNDYPYLDKQLVIINLEKYREIGSPFIGFFEESDVLELHKPIRSVNNIHDDYTPHWLKPSGEVVSVLRRDFGWNLINESLNHGLTVRNIPDEVRWSKRYLYPHDRPHTFSRCLIELSEDRLITIPSKMTPNQVNYLQELMTPGIYCSIYLFNTESLVDLLPPIRPVAKKIFGVAAGFKLFVLWHMLNEPNEVVYYDINRESLRVWQGILAHWDGVDFQKFCEQRGYAEDFSKIDDVLQVIGPDFRAIWQRFQATRPRFVQCDLLRHPEPIIDMMASEGNYIWFSNCFGFYESIRRYGLAGVKKKEQDFLALVKAKAADTICIGSGVVFDQ